MLSPTPQLTAEDARVPDEIDVMRLDLRRIFVDTPASLTDGLRQVLTADAIAASNSIEGFQVSTVDART